VSLRAREILGSLASSLLLLREYLYKWVIGIARQYHIAIFWGMQRVEAITYVSSIYHLRIIRVEGKIFSSQRSDEFMYDRVARGTTTRGDTQLAVYRAQMGIDGERTKD
jgi:hypothetical protein